jgi:hypothetical protein
MDKSITVFGNIAANALAATATDTCPNAMWFSLDLNLADPTLHTQPSVHNWVPPKLNSKLLFKTGDYHASPRPSHSQSLSMVPLPAPRYC